MKPTHYHTGITNIPRCVTVIDGKRPYTSDGVYVDTTDLKPVSELVGRAVRLGDSVGVIKEALSDDGRWCEDKYIGSFDNHFTSAHKTCYNEYVGVYWSEGLENYWQPLRKLNLI